jgi:hypothetical protein
MFSSSEISGSYPSTQENFSTLTEIEPAVAGGKTSTASAEIFWTLAPADASGTGKHGLPVPAHS